MLARGMSVQQAKDAILSDVETAFAAAGLLDDTPQQKPGLRVISHHLLSHALACLSFIVSQQRR